MFMNVPSPFFFFHCAVNLCVPSQRRPGRQKAAGCRSKEDDSQIEAKLQEITKQTGILKLQDKSFDFTIDDLETVEEIGSGTCGQVCKMRHKQSGHVLAVKVRNYTVTHLMYFIIKSTKRSPTFVFLCTS
ncbi:dual specificity mitogen-activated protein kinase kinase 2-like [Oculina patagonica]